MQQIALIENPDETNGDRLMSYNGDPFLYDVLGNPTVYRGKSLTWEKARQLASFDGISFTYDGIGRCTQMGENTIAYDHGGNIVEANGLRVLYDHTGVFAVKYNDSTYFYRKNAQNDIVALLDNTGAVVVEYKYDAWGKCKVLNPDGTENTSATFIGNINPFRYRGYYFDTNTGLYYLKSRFYDPETGRFLNADAIDYLEPDKINGLNLYAYCGNNPIMNTDPTGHKWYEFWKWDWARIGTIVMGIYSLLAATSPLLNSLGYELRTSAGWESSSNLLTGILGRIGYSWYDTYTQGRSGVLYAFAGSTADVMNLFGTTYYAGVGINLFDFIKAEVQLETAGVGAQISIGEFSVGANANLIGGTSITIARNIVIGEGVTRTKGVTLGFNTIGLIATAFWLYKVVTTGDVTPLPGLVTV